MIRTATRGLLGLAAMLLSTAAWADQIPGLYNTGVDASGRPMADGQTEIHYRVNGEQGSTYQHPAWVAADDAHWISALPNGQFTVNPGQYTLTFDLTGLDPRTARIVGKFAGDDEATVSLNGGPVLAHVGTYGGFASFTIASGFQPGINVLTFTVTDGGGAPAGLTVSGLSGTAERMQPPAWSAGGYGAWSETCGTATRTRTVTCVSPTDGATLSESSCSAAGPKPATAETSYQTSGCSYSWTPGRYGSPAPACGNTTMSRTVTCRRSDGQDADPALCDPATKPVTEAGATDYGLCSYSWTADPWSAPSTTCGTATQTRAVSCLRSDQSTVADSFCSQAGARPVTSQSSYQTSGCGYSWDTGEWSGLVAACGPTVENRSITCERSDGQAAPDASCPAGTRPIDQRPGTSYATCGYAWEAGSWSAPSRTCGTSTRSRTVSCLRSDGSTVSDDSCTGQRPETSETIADFSTCSYQWQYTAFGETAPACGPSVRTRTATCLRQDGTTVDGTLCGAQEALSKPYDDFSACTFQWSAGSWSTPSACGQTTRTRTVTCTRSDSTTVDADQCDGGSRPSTSEAVTDTTACQYSWVQTAFGEWGACAGGSQSRTVTAECRRSDGTVAADGLCQSARPSSESRGCTGPVTPPTTGPSGGEIIFRRVIDVVRE